MYLSVCTQKAFEIEAEGELQVSPEEEAQQLERFLGFIRMRKAVELEEVAAEFNLKTKVRKIHKCKKLRFSGDLIISPPYFMNE